MKNKFSLQIFILLLSFFFSSCYRLYLENILEGRFELKEIVDVKTKRKTKIDINSYTTDIFPGIDGNAINFTSDDKFSFYYQHEGNDNVIDGTFEVDENRLTLKLNDGQIISRQVTCYNSNSFIVVDTIIGKQKALELVKVD